MQRTLSIFNSDKKIMIRRVLGPVAVICITVCVLTSLTGLMQKKESIEQYAPFFEHSKDIDVLFFGSSHMEESLSPMELWHDYGITSYNLGSSACQLGNSYWVMENSFDYANPKVVVIDCCFLECQRKTSESFGLVHKSLDAFPLSQTKILAINDLIDDPEIDRLIEAGEIDTSEKRTRIGLLWDYSVYHSRWEELGKDDFDIDKTKEYGAFSACSIYKAPEFVENNGSVIDEETVGISYLKKMIESCQSRDIEVILTFIPYFITDSGGWGSVNTAGQIAEEYGVDYLNFMSNELYFLDPNKDYADAGGHLNLYGAKKITKYIGKVLSEDYGISDHRGDIGYEYWDDDYDVYMDCIALRLKETK